MRSLGYTVEAFPSAADFLASPRLSETACLIADVHMPAMTGIELYLHLIEAGRAIPTILVTAYPNDVERARPHLWQFARIRRAGGPTMPSLRVGWSDLRQECHQCNARCPLNFGLSRGENCAGWAPKEAAELCQ
jgi:CheY-like chemotaxis protein